jgi:hypothetical protein
MDSLYTLSIIMLVYYDPNGCAFANSGRCVQESTLTPVWIRILGLCCFEVLNHLPKSTLGTE